MCRPLNASCSLASSHLPDDATNSTTFGETPVRSVSSVFVFLEEEKVTRSNQNLSHTGGTLATKTRS